MVRPRGIREGIFNFAGKAPLPGHFGIQPCGRAEVPASVQQSLPRIRSGKVPDAVPEERGHGELGLANHRLRVYGCKTVGAAVAAGARNICAPAVAGGSGWSLGRARMFR